MIDSMTQRPIVVSTDGDAGPYIIVPMDQLDAVTTLLQDGHVDFWVDSQAISIDGQPEVTVVNLSGDADAGQIQQRLDRAD